jgi:hypothetical protein
VVDTAAHWPAAYVADAGIPLARGWYRQADYPQNDLLYRRLTAPGYDAWLRRLGVAYVVLSDVRPDFSARQEAQLLASGRSGLTVVRREGRVTIFAVPAPTAIVSGPGEPQVTELDHDSLRLRVDQPGEFHLAVQWSPYWDASHGCLSRAPDGMTVFRTGEPGTVTIDHRVRIAEALRVLTGREERCGPGGPGLVRGERPHREA